VEIV
jgi:PHD/YefM family antitoxin component YafN of YafNO toxin-antitoxin module